MDTKRLIEYAHDTLARLQRDLQLTAALATFTDDGLHGIVVLSLGGGKVFNFTPRVGYEFPLHATGPGKAMLAALPDDRLGQRIASMELEAYTDTTITDAKELLDVLRTDRQRGYSVDHGEIVVGIHCVSAPIRDPEMIPCAAIWLTAPSVDLPEKSFARLGRRLKAAAGDIEMGLSSGRRSPGTFMKRIVGEARECMAADLSRHMDVEALAANFNIGYDWFRKKFKQETGESPTQYHTRLRIEKAQRLLSLTDLSVKEIAAQLGYESQDYFSAFFKKKVGMSPTHYRANTSS